MTRKASWAEMKKAHQNTVVPETITLRGDLLAEVDRLEADMRAAEAVDKWENRAPVAPQIAEQIRALEAEARESEVTFKFQGLGRGAYAKLIARHPATPEQRKQYADAGGEGELPYDMETFPPALMAACCIEPEDLHGDVKEWAEIHAEWNGGQVSKLWEACLLANTGVAHTPKSRAASEVLARHSSESNSTTAVH